MPLRGHYDASGLRIIARGRRGRLVICLRDHRISGHPWAIFLVVWNTGPSLPAYAFARRNRPCGGTWSSYCERRSACGPTRCRGRQCGRHGPRRSSSQGRESIPRSRSELAGCPLMTPAASAMMARVISSVVRRGACREAAPRRGVDVVEAPVGRPGLHAPPPRRRSAQSERDREIPGAQPVVDALPLGARLRDHTGG